MNSIQITGTIETVSDQYLLRKTWYLDYTIDGITVTVPTAYAASWDDAAERPVRLSVGEVVEITAQQDEHGTYHPVMADRSAEAFRRIA